MGNGIESWWNVFVIAIFSFTLIAGMLTTPIFALPIIGVIALIIYRVRKDKKDNHADLRF